MPKVSIIVPVYKVEAYLSACLDSVLSQTFTDWEAICVNDGSPDGCGKILEAYAQKDKRFKIITQENQGVSVARNKALEQAVGRYICFLDSDDELAPAFLEKMLAALKENQSDIAWCDYQQGTEKIDEQSNKMPLQVYSDVFDRFLTENPTMGACIWNKIYKKELIKEFCFPVETGIGEDLVFLYKVLYQTKRASFIPERLYFYRIREDSAIHSSLSQKIVLGNIKTAELLFDYFESEELSLKTRKILNQKVAKRMFKFAVLEPKRKDKANLDKWYALTRPLLAELKQQGIYQPKYMSLKNQLKSWMFLKGKK